MKKIKEKTKVKAKHLKKELRKAMSTALIAAFGFLMALVWRDVIQSGVDKISSTSPVQGQLVSATIVTIICVVGILIVTKYLKEKE